MAKRHGRKRFYIVGEGVYGERNEGDVDGKLLVRAAAADAAAGADGARFRFSRIAPAATSTEQLGQTTRKSLAEAMTAAGGAPSTIPSGFTYLGQFIDHDLTSDKTGTPLGQDESPATMLQGRSPALDLDSLYGDGPNDPASEQFYKADLLHLKAGGTDANPHDGFDLPRTGSTPGPADIPDPRNDENLAVAQTHLAFIRFHNRVVDTLPANTPASVAFMRARKQVTRHYQWIIKTDFLPRICEPAVVDDVFTNGRKIFEVGVPPTQVPTMPIEFSVAAYRLGHSMVRAAYNWNAVFPNGAGTLPLLFNFSGTSGVLSGTSPLPSIWIADFRRLYDFSESGKANLVVPPNQFNDARRIDTKIANPLAQLPQQTIGPPPSPLTSPQHNLAFRNLTRAKMVRLPTGQDMVAFLATKGVNVTAAHGKRDPKRLRRRHRPGSDRAGRRHEHAALVLHPPRGRTPQRTPPRRGGADRRRNVPPSDGGKRDIDPARATLHAVQGSRQPGRNHLPDGRSPLLRVRGETQPAEPQRAGALATWVVRSPVRARRQRDTGGRCWNPLSPNPCGMRAGL